VALKLLHIKKYVRLHRLRRRRRPPRQLYRKYRAVIFLEILWFTTVYLVNLQLLHYSCHKKRSPGLTMLVNDFWKQARRIRRRLPCGSCLNISVNCHINMIKRDFALDTKTQLLSVESESCQKQNKRTFAPNYSLNRRYIGHKKNFRP
jgi:hypothetical protein